MKTTSQTFRLSFGLLAAAVVLGFAAPARADDTYAAIAVSPSTAKYGYAVKYASREEAEQKAVKFCDADDAKAVVWVRNGWCALAKVGSNYGWDKGETAAEARANAVMQCSKYGDAPAVVVCISSAGQDDAQPEAPPGGDAYAAIAVSMKTGKYGYAVKYASREEAEKKAVTFSDADDAKAVVWVHDGWCAVAVDDNQYYGWDKGRTADEARTNALEACRKYGKDGPHPRLLVCVSSDGKVQK